MRLTTTAVAAVLPLAPVNTLGGLAGEARLAVTRWFAEREGSVSGFGAFNDGTRHTVAEWISAGTYASLAAVTAVFPHVTAATDSADWAALVQAKRLCEGVFVPAGAGLWVDKQVLITTSDKCRLLCGKDPRSSIILNKTTGDGISVGAPSCIAVKDDSLTHLCIRDLQVLGNGTTGFSGNGHGIALLDAGSGGAFGPQGVRIERVWSHDNAGKGLRKDGTTAADAAGLYCEGGLANYVDHCHFQGNQDGVTVYSATTIISSSGGVYEHHFSHTISYLNIRAGFRLTNAENCTFLACGAVQNGSGNASEGGFVLDGVDTVLASACRIKDNYPLAIDLYNGTAAENFCVTFQDCSILQLTTGLAAAVKLHNGCKNLRLIGGKVYFSSTITTAIGIELAHSSTFGGFDCKGLVVDGVRFDSAGGATAIRWIVLNEATNTCKGPQLKNLQFGNDSDYSAATTWTSCVELRGFVESALVDGLYVKARSNLTITTGLLMSGVGITDPVIRQVTSATAGSGAITALVSDTSQGSRRDLAGGTVWKPRTAAPAAPVTGMLSIADRATWDPLAKGSGGPYFVWYNGSAWASLSGQ